MRESAAVLWAVGGQVAGDLEALAVGLGSLQWTGELRVTLAPDQRPRTIITAYAGGGRLVITVDWTHDAPQATRVCVEVGGATMDVPPALVRFTVPPRGGPPDA